MAFGKIKQRNKILDWYPQLTSWILQFGQDRSIRSKKFMLFLYQLINAYHLQVIPVNSTLIPWLPTFVDEFVAPGAAVFEIAPTKQSSIEEKMLDYTGEEYDSSSDPKSVASKPAIEGIAHDGADEGAVEGANEGRSEANDPNGDVIVIDDEDSGDELSEQESNGEYDDNGEKTEHGDNGDISELITEPGSQQAEHDNGETMSNLNNLMSNLNVEISDANEEKIPPLIEENQVGYNGQGLVMLQNAKKEAETILNCVVQDISIKMQHIAQSGNKLEYLKNALPTITNNFGKQVFKCKPQSDEECLHNVKQILHSTNLVLTWKLHAIIVELMQK